MSDQDRISPYNINTISIRQVVRIFVWDIFSIGQTKKFTTICIPTDWNFPIFENSTLISRTKRKERKDALKLWKISWPQIISLEILQRTTCVSLSCVPLSTVFLVINEPCVYFWVCLSEDNIRMREVATITSMRMNWNFSCSYWTKLLFRRSVQEILSQSEILRFVCVSQAFSSPFSSVGEKTTATQGCKKILSCARHYLLLFTGFICLCILFPLLDKDKVFFVCSRGKP